MALKQTRMDTMVREWLVQTVKKKNNSKAVCFTLFSGVDRCGCWSTDASGGHSVQRHVVPHTRHQT